MNVKSIAKKFPKIFPHYHDDKKTSTKIRSDSRTPLGKISIFDRGSTPVKSLRNSATF